MNSKQLSIRDMTPKKDTVIRFRINTKLKKQFEKYAKANNKTMTELITNAIEKYVKE